MKYLFIEYPKCSTCIKAKKFLEENKVDFEDRHIVENNPTEEELKTWIKKYNLEIKKLFNTSGLMYKDLKLKDKLPQMLDDEKIKLLASDGMLVKRPILLCDDFFINGFNEDKWKEKI